MGKKYDIIEDLYRQTCDDITSSTKSWTKFLTAASKNYKCRFDEQVLIYAQRPDATAVLEIQKWNNYFKRWVVAGAKGIAVFSDDSQKNDLTYYFDITDTKESKTSRVVPLWEMKPTYEENVIESLENTFGELECKTDTATSVFFATSNAIENDQEVYNSYLCEYDSDPQTLAKLKQLVCNSVSFMVISRLGIDTSTFFDEQDFSDISFLNNKNIINDLGNAVSEISKSILMNITHSIQLYQVNKSINENINMKNERGSNNERDDFSSRGRIFDSRFDFIEPTTARGQDGQVRTSSGEVLEGTSAKNLLQLSDNRNITPTFDGSSEPIDGDVGNTYRPNGKKSGGYRELENDRPNALGGTDEQHQTFSRGNGIERVDLLLDHVATSNLPSVDEQIQTIAEAEEEKSSAFSFSQEDIDSVLTHGSGVRDGKYRIYSQFQNHESRKSNVNFLKNEYGISGGPHVFSDGVYGYIWRDSKGIDIEKNDFHTKVSWTKVENRLSELVVAGRYLSDKEKSQYPAYLAEEEKLSERIKVGKEFKNIIREYNDYMDGIGERDQCLNRYVLMDCGECFAHSKQRTNAHTIQGDNILPLMENALNTIVAENTPLTDRALSMIEILNSDMSVSVIPEPELEYKYQYHLGDTVYIGANNYVILSFDDADVRLYDNNFPILNKVIERKSFDEMVQENPSNNHLKVVVKETSQASIQETESVYSEESKIKTNNMAIEEATKDITFDEAEAVPSEGIESAEGIHNLIDDNMRKIKSPKNPTNLLPGIKQEERSQYVITDDNLGHGGAKEKFKANMEAIQVLKECEKEKRFASIEEQDVLARYVGFGCLADAFDSKKSAWANEYQQLINALSTEEYEAARESTLTAFYTPPAVIKSMYQLLENIGFHTGNVLEPSCGTGNFIGLMPDIMKNSKIYGVELDSLTGRIAQQLYQKSNIAVQGYETTSLPNSFFDVAIGNVPFGQFKLADSDYDKQKWLVHDYFFGKTLDKIRPGGIIAFITSKGTLDKENASVRKYIAQRAELIGAIRLPNNTFKANAGTEVTSDIVFLQKREHLIDIVPDWIHLGKDKNGLAINQYFIDNPNMVIGEMKEISGQYGTETACIAKADSNLSDCLNNAIQNIHTTFAAYDIEEKDESKKATIPADPEVRNFSFTAVGGEVYFRENSQMTLVSLSSVAKSRVKGMIEIRDCMRHLIDLQKDDFHDSDIEAEQVILNKLYDGFTKEYGLISSRANSTVFIEDSSYFLLSSLEVLDENKNLKSKAAIFTKRTIKPHMKVSSVDTANEALAVSISEKAQVDIDFMCKITGKSEKEIFDSLNGVIYLNPQYEFWDKQESKYLTASEYLSGNVRQKLNLAKKATCFSPNTGYDLNVEALEKVQPKDLNASEIYARLGSTWIPENIVQDFMYELLNTPAYAKNNIKVLFSKYTAEWSVSKCNYDSRNVKAYSIYGTSRINAYKIIEETLNLKDVRIFDYKENDKGNRIAILNSKETYIAQAKQETIKECFKNWIWKSPQRRGFLEKIYNEKFNSVRPREYDGSHIALSGINPEYTLRKHQINAVARIMYGGNTLLGHVVGAGKTIEMIAAAMESKRLGLCNKSLFVVPNHLIGQWTNEFFELYPSANLLVSTEKDFTPANRKRFTGRIATGDYDAIIIGHSQFEKIPMSIEQQRTVLEEQLNEVVSGILTEQSKQNGRFTVKQLERTKKSIKSKLDFLNKQTRKDNVISFEELGIDRLFVDEAHSYKNLYIYTKMRNVGGISQTEAQKSSDLFLKCRYLDKLTNGHGTIFATGTPISNSMVELYTLQRYLQHDRLNEMDLTYFDAWASNFGETVTTMELAPEGTGYRAKTRFAKFHNLPELMYVFKEVADIQTADMLNLPVPKANYHTISAKPSEMQKEMVVGLAERANLVRDRKVDSSKDNMLKITNDGRKLALDQRLVNNMLPDFENSKINACVDNIYNVWSHTVGNKSAQLVFCDLSTPKGDGKFNVYDDMRNKLIEKGIPREEVAFIHEAPTKAKRSQLFTNVRNGAVRVLFGSTAKMGAGTNVQKKLVAIHDIDCPWRPSDLEQRAGRIVRQGNENAEVDIFRYVTEQTFDAYLYQLVENKQKFISQIMTSKSPVRSAEDIDEASLSYAEIKMLATGDPNIKEKMDLDIQLSKLKMLKQNFLSERYMLEDKLVKEFPITVTNLSERIKGLHEDINILAENTPTSKDDFHPMKIGETVFCEKEEAGNAILEVCKAMTSAESVTIGEYRGFNMKLEFDTFGKEYKLVLKGNLSHTVTLGRDVHGNIKRINNALENIPSKLEATKQQLENVKVQIKTAEMEATVEFPGEEKLIEKGNRLNELNFILNSANSPIELETSAEKDKEHIFEEEFER